MRLRTISAADTDVAESATWLEGQKVGLGNAFLDAVADTFEQIVSAPLACPTFVSEIYCYKSILRFRGIGRFAYRVIFTVEADEVVVVAVLHPHRDLDSILRERIGTK